MAVVLRSSEELSKERFRHTVKDTDVVLIARRPTYAEVLHQDDGQNLGDHIANKLKILCGWEGIEDQDGKTVPFNPQTWGQACGQLPNLFDEAFSFVIRIFRGVDKEAGNQTAGAPSSDGSPAEESSQK